MSQPRDFSQYPRQSLDLETLILGILCHLQSQSADIRQRQLHPPRQAEIRQAILFRLYGIPLRHFDSVGGHQIAPTIFSYLITTR